MLRKPITWCTLVCFIITLFGCTGYSRRDISRDELTLQESKICEVVTSTGEVYVFQEDADWNYARFQDSTIVGTLEDGELITVPMSQVTRITVLRVDAVKTFLYVVGGTLLVVGVVALIVLATKESCPFVYSYDGERYVFDGEPYGGAICEGLKRTDWARLEHLKPVDGTYRLLLTNEVDETQFTDEFKLWVIDHRPEVEVALDAFGHVYTVAQRVKPAKITGNHGNDLRLWLGENDKRIWESDMRSRSSEDPGDLRDSLRLTFTKPADVHAARLVVSGGTTLWGSQMLKRMTELRGETIPQWYEGMKSVENRNLLDLWNVREELYHLQVRVRVGDGWQTRGVILGGGPFVTEERVVPLDLRGAEGETVEILLTPAVGFWQLNSFALDYTTTEDVEVREIEAEKAAGDEGEDLLSLLSATDSRYYAAPRSGQSASLTFAVPADKPGTRRTVFAKASGYYEMHMTASGPPRMEILNRIALEPGYPATFAVGEYLQWKKDIGQAGKTGTGGSQ